MKPFSEVSRNEVSYILQKELASHPTRQWVPPKLEKTCTVFGRDEEIGINTYIRGLLARAEPNVAT